MNAAMGMLTGLAFGWVTYGMLGGGQTLTRKTALLVGVFAAVVATIFQPIFDASGTNAAFRLVGIAWAAFAASLAIIALSLVARRIGRD